MGPKYEQKTIPGEAIIVFGQDQDEFKGGYDHQQAFSGWIADFGISERVLNIDEIKNISACKALFGGDIFSTENIENGTNGWEISKIKIIDQDDIGHFCEEDHTLDIATMQGGLEFQEANGTCSVMGGRLLTVDVAGNMAEMVADTLWEHFEVHGHSISITDLCLNPFLSLQDEESPLCLFKEKRNALFWLADHWSVTRGAWVNPYTGQEHHDLDYVDINPNSTERKLLHF